MTDTDLLDWVRRHDWGHDAYLNGPWVSNLTDRWVDAYGHTHEFKVSVLADYKTLREWAGY